MKSPRLLLQLLRQLAPVLLCLALGSCTKAARQQRVLNRAETYFQAGQFDQAKVEYSNLLRLDQRSPLPYQRLGAIWFEEGAQLRAAPFLLKARELAPDDLASRLKLARLLVALGHRNEAFAEAIELLQRWPNNGEAAQVAAEAAQTDDERKKAEQAIAKIPDQTDAAVQLAIANLALAKGDAAGGKKAVQNAVAADPKSAVAHVFLGTLLLAERQTVQAGEELKTAAELSPPRSAERLRYAQFQLQSGATEDALTTLRSITTVAPDFLPAWLLQAEISLTKKDYPEALRLLANVLNRDPDNIDGNVLQARIWMASSQLDKALQTLQRLDSEYPNFAPLKLELARAYVQKNNLPQAATALEQALIASPDYSEAALLLGQINLRTGKPQPVVDSMKKVIAKHPEAAAAKLMLADAYRALGRLDDAANLFRERVNILPNDVEACIALGIILRQQHKNDEARNLLERALRLAPANTIPLVQLVEMDLAAGDFDGARGRIEQQRQATSNPAVLDYLHGKVFIAEKRWDRAEAALTQAISENANFTPAYELLATAYIATNKNADAARQLEVVMRRVPEDTRILMILGGLYEKLHEFEKARDVYEKALTIAPDFAPALNNLAFVYTEHFNQLDRAYQLANKARGLLPGDGSIADTLAWVHFKQRDYEQAIALLGEAVAKSPNDPEIRYHLGMCRYMMGDADAARAAFEQALKSPTDFPNKADAEHRLAMLSNSQGNTTMTVEELQAIVHQQPDDVLAQTRLAEQYQANGSFKKAAAQYEQILKLNPKSTSAMAKLADLYAVALNDPNKALDFARSARDLSPGDSRLDLLVGRIVYKTGNYSWAYSLLKQAANELPNDPDAAYELGWSAFSVGKVSEAAECMERVARTAPATFPGSAMADDAKTWLAFAKLERDAPTTADATNQIAAELKKDPGYIPALLAQAAIAAKTGDSDRAISLYQQVLKRLPEFAPAQKRLASLYAQRPADLTKAYEFAMKARKALPDDVELTRTLGEISYQRRDYSRALELLQETARKQPLDTNDLYYLGMCYLQTKDRDQARASLNQALARGLPDPMATEAAKALQQLK